MEKGKGQRAKGKGKGQGLGKEKGEERASGDKGGVDKAGPESIDGLYQLPLTEFTPARNVLATRLRKTGDTGRADEVKSLVKPSIPAWAVNQVYWKHRVALDRLLGAGDRLRKAQSSTLAGKSGDVRSALDDVRERLSELSKLAAGQLESAGHNPSPGVMRAVTATLEALSAYGTSADAPRAGRLVDEVDPPGFETLAALVPNAGGSAGRDTPSRLLRFRQDAPAAKPHKTRGDEHAREEERQARLAAAKAAVSEAEDALRQARATAQQAQASLKKAAANAKDTETAMIEAEQVLEKAAKEAHTARQLARRLAVEAEASAQAVDEAERHLDRSKKEVDGLTK